MGNSVDDMIGRSAPSPEPLTCDDPSFLALYPEMGITDRGGLSWSTPGSNPETALAPDVAAAWARFDAIAEALRQDLRLARDQLRLLTDPG